MAGKKDIVEQALKLVMGSGPELTESGIRAYHGSPYKFDRFDISKLGTGEGNQSFGHGLYFAGKEDIADWYKKKLAYKNLKERFLEELPSNAEFSEVEELLGSGHFSPEQERLLTELRDNDWLGFDYPSQAISAATKDLNAYDPTPSLKDAADRLGHMYEVDIAADPNRLLDWNDPLKAQSPDVQSAIMPFAEYRANVINRARKAALDKGVDFRGRPYDGKKLEMLKTAVNPEELSGEQIYRQLQSHLGAVNPGEKADEASKYLLDQGLSGIQYLDASSRAPGLIEPTKNFVIPDDRLVTIKRRYEDGGEVSDERDGYGGGGEIVEKALKLVMGGTDDAAEKAFANTSFKTPQGKPMRLYHMTPADITEFRASPENRSGPAVFLSPYADYQPAYHQAAETGPDGEITDVFKEGANVMPVYADVRNPLVLDHPRKIKEAAAKYQGGDREFPRYLSPEARAALEAEGYDGIILGGINPIPYGDRPMDARLGHQEARDEEFLVFDPRRIKSAITNTGEYDFTNPDITKADGGQVRDGYAGRGRVAKSIADEAVELAKRLVGDAPEKTVVKGSELLKKSPSLSDDPFNYSKFSKPLNEMEYTVEKLPNMEPYKSIDPYDLVKQNALIAGHISDRTAAGRKLTNVGGDDLVEPLRQRGGADYQRTTLNAWANRPGAAKSLNRKLNEAAGYVWDSKEKMFVPRKGGPEEAPLYTTPVFMGASSANSSHMVGVPLLRMIPNLPISQADKLAFDAMMSERFPGWPGIDKTKEAEDFMYKGKIPGSAISKFVKYAAAKKWRGAGFPDVEEIMFSSMDPRLVGVPQGSTGFGFKEFSPGRTPIVKTNDYHPDYPAAIPGKEYAGGFRYQVPQGLMLPDWWKSLSPELRDPANATKAQHTLMTQVPIQRATPEWADNILEYWEKNPMPWGYQNGGVVDDDDIDEAVRIAKDVGGGTPVLMEDAKGNKYDAQGNIIPPTNPGPNPARSDVTPQSVAAQAVNDPATYDALMERYAVPDRDIAEYEALKETVGRQPQDIQQMTHVGDRPKREVTVDMPLFGGEYSMGQAPYDVASGISGAAQTAYDLKTVPFYFNPFTAPVAAGMDVAEGIATQDPLTAGLAIAFGPGGKYAKAAGVGATSYLMNADNAEAGPERWFSKAMEVARALPMEKMTGQQALAMLRKGVSPEELKWTGADTFLPQQKQITKQDLVDYLAKNRVQMNEVVLGGNKPTHAYDVVPSDVLKEKYQPQLDAVQNKLNQLARDYEVAATLPFDDPNYMSLYTYRKEREALMDEGAALEEQMRNEAVAEIGGLAAPTKYHDYSTAGGEGYTETLYQYGRQKSKPNVVEKDGMWEVVDESGEVMRSPNGKAYSYWSRNDAERAARSLYRESGSYQSPHWNDPNVIAHTRSNTLTYEPPGSNRPYRVHNVEETQSDLAQQGRKTGFRGPDIDKRLNELELERNKLNSQHSKARQEIEREFKEATKSISDEYNNRVRQIELAHSRGETNYREYEEQLGDAMTWYGDNVKPYREKSSVRYMAEVAPLEAQEDVLRREVAELNKSKNLPPLMPYVGSTEGWTDFAIKRELDKALDSDADYFSWSPGDVHAERYDLSKHIGKVQYNPDDGSLLAYDPKGKMVVNESVNDPDDLDEYLGKELADKMRLEADSRRSAIDEYEIDKDEETGEWTAYLYGEPIGETFSSKGDVKLYLNEMMANEFAQSPVELSGLDLKVGGEGMRGYYDKIYLKRVQDVIKKSTGVKPEIETITVNTADGPRQQLGIRITDEMREKARFSDFNKGGRVSDPVVNKALSLTANM